MSTRTMKMVRCFHCALIVFSFACAFACEDAKTTQIQEPNEADVISIGASISDHCAGRSCRAELRWCSCARYSSRDFCKEMECIQYPLIDAINHFQPKWHAVSCTSNEANPNVSLWKPASAGRDCAIQKDGDDWGYLWLRLFDPHVRGEGWNEFVEVPSGKIEARLSGASAYEVWEE